MTRYGDAATLEQARSSLDALSFGDLKQLYHKRNKRIPLTHRPHLLILAIAYEMRRKSHRIRVDRLNKRIPKLACPSRVVVQKSSN